MSTEPVVLEIPAEARFLTVARVAAAGLVADLEPDIECVENLRLAVNEAVSLLVDAAAHDGAGSRIRIELSEEGPYLCFLAHLIGQPGVLSVDELTSRILDATAEPWSYDAEGVISLRLPLDRA